MDNHKNANQVMLQTFEWYTTEYELYQKLPEKIERYQTLGISTLWLPPPFRGKTFLGIDGEEHQPTGYTPYDLYDLGEFCVENAKNCSTKYGNKEELIDLMRLLNESNMKSIIDITFNHLCNADDSEDVLAHLVDYGNRNQLLKQDLIKLFTKFNYDHRNNQYSDFKFDHRHFTGADNFGIWKINDWNWEVDGENGNFDFLMGADINHSNPEVRDELMKWGTWLNHELKYISGYRIDAAKHIQFEFQQEWLTSMRNYTQKPQFCVAEYYTYDLKKIEHYLHKQNWQVSCFDFPLHFQFRQASKTPFYDLRNLLYHTLVSKHKFHAVTFVDNHDTQCRGLGVYASKCVEPWFKPHAYAFILLREEGSPCVFVGDLEGTNPDPFGGVPALAPIEVIPRLLEIRQTHNIGMQHTWHDDPHCLAWTREGIDHQTGLAVLLSNHLTKTKSLYVGEQHAGQTWYEAMTGQPVHIDEWGNGVFTVNENQIAVYTPVAYTPLLIHANQYQLKLYVEHSIEGQTVFHYRTFGQTNWQSKPMNDCQFEGFQFIELDLGQQLGLECAIQRGDGTWDCTFGQNHQLCAGEFTIAHFVCDIDHSSYRIEPGDPSIVQKYEAKCNVKKQKAEHI